jgi:hypothetical protein
MPREGVLEAIYVDNELHTGIKAPRNIFKRARELFIYSADSILKTETSRGVSPTRIFELQGCIEHRNHSGLTEGFESMRNSLGRLVNRGIAF